MSFTYRSSAQMLLLLIALLALACTPSRGRGNNNGGGGGDDDDAAGDDDDAAGDDDDATGDDDDSVGGSLYYGDVYGGLKGGDGGGECAGTAEIYIDAEGVVTQGTLTCGDACIIEFSGPYAFSEAQFTPTLDCSVNGYTPNVNEFDAWIWGSQGEYAEGNVSAYGSDYFYVSFNAYLQLP